MGASRNDLRTKIGKLIYSECEDFFGIAPSASSKIASHIWKRMLDDFLHTPRGFDLIFWAMNEVYKREAVKLLHPIYDVEPNDWKTALINHAPSPVIDIHTHLVRDEKPPERDLYFEMGKMWWFAPERFFLRNAGATAITNTAIRPDAFKREQFKWEMFGRNEDTKQIIISSASPEEPEWMISQDDIVKTCRDIEQLFGQPAAHPTGKILIGTGGSGYELDPDPRARFRSRPAQADQMTYWKIYSGAGWPCVDIDWLVARGADGAFQELLEIKDSRPVVCIHWSRGHDSVLPTPDKTQARPQIPAYPEVEHLSELARNNPDIDFVIFHAAYPDHEKLARFTVNHSNLFIEIGAIFSGLVMRLDRPYELVDFINSLEKEARKNSVLWGTDAIWYGSPQWQIEAFRRLRLSDDNSPQATKKERAFKQKVFHDNAQTLFRL